MKIQRFTSWDELKEDYNNLINTTNAQLSNLDGEKQTELNNYNNNYNNQLNTYNTLMQNQQNYIDEYKNTQTENQQKQTDYNVGIINQNKEKAQKETDSNVKTAYQDYENAINPYGQQAEQTAKAGLTGSGLDATVQGNMFRTYQNRVGVAKQTLQEANLQYDNQIQQALLNNDASLAEIALQAMQQSYQLALQGFQYTSEMNNSRLQFETNLNDRYFSKQNDLQSRIDSYKNEIADINNTQETFRLKEIEMERERQNQQEADKQWWANFNEQKREWEENYKANNVVYNDTPEQKNEKNNKTTTNIEKSQSATKLSNGTKLSLSSWDTSQVPGLNKELGLNSSVCKNIYSAGGKYYYYDASNKIHIDITNEVISQLNKNSKEYTNKINATKSKLTNPFGR